MAKKKSTLHKLIEHASTAGEDEVSLLIEALQAVKDARFKKQPRKPRSDAGKARTVRNQPDTLSDQAN